MKRFCLIILFICAYGFLNAQCYVVNDNGSVTITAANNGEFTLQRQDNDNWIDLGNSQNGTYTDEEINANEGSVTYRITVDDVATEFSTLYCQVAVNGQSIQLTWQPANEGSKYAIYRQTVEQSAMTFLAEVPITENSYEDTREGECDIYYQVSLIDEFCENYSNKVKVPKTDNQEPEQPTLLPIDVDLTTQKIVISWQASTSDDVDGYVICKNDENGIRQSLDTITDKTQTSYTCDKCDISEVNAITIFAYDFCKNTSPLSATYNNIVLTGDRGNCEEPLHLSWNAPNLTQEAKTYDIYMATEENPTYISIAQTTNFSYDVVLPQVNGKIHDYVSCGVKSNVVTIDVSMADTLKFVDLESVSIKPDNMQAELYVYLDASKKVKGYTVMRKIDDGEFEAVNQIPFSGYSYLKFVDELPMPANEHTYTYMIAAPDVCGGNFTYSNTLTPIRLEVDATNQSKIKLSWNPYKPTTWNVAGYEVYRFAENDFDNAELLKTTTANSYTDDITDMVSATDRTYYYVKAIAAQSDNPDITENGANSSNAYAKFETIFFVPNAFAPKDGVHEKLRTFKPSCHFVRAGTYSFKVFNRAGTVLFETNDTEKGWDGKYKNEFCPVGTYIYKVSFIDSDGMEQNKGGAFLLYD